VIGGPPGTGFVSLVGAGPGNPELITLRALERLREAEAVVYDRLIPMELLDHCPPFVERYDVGKSPGRHGHGSQEAINDLLVELGRSGRRVVRLKGGDPFVFGRGGEEALALARADVRFEVVPGVSSAVAAPAAAGIPVTHRGVAASVTIATGHGRTGAPEADHDWDALAKMRGTLVFLMAVENLEYIVEQLLNHGRRAAEPAALVRWGTTEQQTTLTSRLGEIVSVARAAALAPPAVIVVGDVVGLAAEIGVQQAVAHRLAAM